MKKSIRHLLAGVVALCICAIWAPAVRAEVTATLLLDKLNENVPDPENNRDYFNVSYKIAVQGAKGHTLRAEFFVLDANGKKVEDTGCDPAYSSRTHEVEADTDTIEGWTGHYYDSVWLKPGPHKVSVQLKLFDETAGCYVEPFESKKHTFNIVSEQEKPGIVVDSQWLDHNVYYDDIKSMKLNYSFHASWLKGKKIKVVLRLYKANGTPIYTTGGKVDEYSWTGEVTYSRTFWNDRNYYFYYSSMKLPKGKTSCYAKISFYDAATGKPIPTKGNNKITFDFTR